MNSTRSKKEHELDCRMDDATSRSRMSVQRTMASWICLRTTRRNSRYSDNLFLSFENPHKIADRRSHTGSHFRRHRCRPQVFPDVQERLERVNLGLFGGASPCEMKLIETKTTFIIWRIYGSFSLFTYSSRCVCVISLISQPTCSKKIIQRFAGVYYEKECSSTQLNHGVLLVGYGTDPEDGDYWLVKNRYFD